MVQYSGYSVFCFVPLLCLVHFVGINVAKESGYLRRAIPLHCLTSFDTVRYMKSYRSYLGICSIDPYDSEFRRTRACVSCVGGTLLGSLFHFLFRSHFRFQGLDLASLSICPPSDRSTISLLWPITIIGTRPLQLDNDKIIDTNFTMSSSSVPTTSRRFIIGRGGNGNNDHNDNKRPLVLRDSDRDNRMRNPNNNKVIELEFVKDQPILVVESNIPVRKMLI